MINSFRYKKINSNGKVKVSVRLQLSKMLNYPTYPSIGFSFRHKPRDLLDPESELASVVQLKLFCAICCFSHFTTRSLRLFGKCLCISFSNFILELTIHLRKTTSVQAVSQQLPTHILDTFSSVRLFGSISVLEEISRSAGLVASSSFS